LLFALHYTLKMEVVRASKTSMNFYPIIRRHIQEYSHVHLYKAWV
jgi:hypothetical protein